MSPVPVVPWDLWVFAVSAASVACCFFELPWLLAGSALTFTFFWRVLRRSCSWSSMVRASQASSSPSSPSTISILTSSGSMFSSSYFYPVCSSSLDSLLFWSTYLVLPSDNLAHEEEEATGVWSLVSLPTNRTVLSCDMCTQEDVEAGTDCFLSSSSSAGTSSTISSGFCYFLATFCFCLFSITSEVSLRVLKSCWAASGWAWLTLRVWMIYTRINKILQNKRYNA